MTCKDCLYYEACVNHYTQGQLTMINGDCSTFHRPFRMGAFAVYSEKELEEKK